MNSKNLVILIGNARGGEETWETMYKHVLYPLDADLALCFGKNENKKSSLYSKAKYIWEIPEYFNWTEYYENKFFNNWKKSFLIGGNSGLAGGLDDYKGSGAIIFAFRHWLKNNVKHIMEQYENIILTRSDFYYIDNHPPIDSMHCFVVEGVYEDYGGITDRHYVFPSSMIDDILGVVEFMDSNEGYEILLQEKREQWLNPEQVLWKYYNYNGVLNKIKRCKRVQFTVAKESDQTRWAKGNITFKNDLFIKYENEYIHANVNVHGKAKLKGIEHDVKQFNK